MNITGLTNTDADGGMMRGRHATVYLPSFSIKSVVRARVSVGGPEGEQIQGWHFGSGRRREKWLMHRWCLRARMYS